MTNHTALITALRGSMLFDSDGNCSALPYDAADEIDRLTALVATVREETRVAVDALCEIAGTPIKGWTIARVALAKLSRP